MKRGSDTLDGGAPLPGAKRGGGVAGRLSVPRAQFCVKVLCNDELVMAIMGGGGSKKDMIQSESGTKFVFSNKGDYFPGTKFRVLGIFADDLRQIHHAFEFIMSEVIECGMKEANLSPDHAENLGKEPGEYIVRLSVAQPCSSALIGPAGNNIKAMRVETGSKVFIENDIIMGHQMVRLIGVPENILSALDRVNEFSVGDAGTPEFQSWAELINFGHAEHTNSHPLVDQNVAVPGGGRDRRSGGREGGDDHSAPGGGRKGGAPGLPVVPKSRLCHFFAQGKCRFGDACLNAHGEEDLRPPDEEPELDGAEDFHAPLDFQAPVQSSAPSGPLKTKMCAFFLKGKCKFGKGCINAHGEHELAGDDGSSQPPPPGGGKKGKGKGKSAEPGILPSPGFKGSGSSLLGPSKLDGGISLMGSGRERPAFPPISPGVAPFGPPTREPPLRHGLSPSVGALREAVESMPEGTADMQYSVTWDLPGTHAALVHGKGGEALERQTGVTVALGGKGSGKDSTQCSVVGNLYGIYAAHILMIKKAYEVEQRDNNRAREMEARQRDLEEQKRQLERKLDLERRAELAKRRLEEQRQETEQRARLEQARKQRELEEQKRVLQQELEAQRALESASQFQPPPPRLSWIVPQRASNASRPEATEAVAAEGDTEGAETAEQDAWSSDPDGWQGGEFASDADETQIENEILDEWGAPANDEAPPEDDFGVAEVDCGSAEDWGHEGEGEYEEGEYEESAGEAVDGLDPTNQEDLQATLASLQAQLAKVQAMAAAAKAKAQPQAPGRPGGTMQGKGGKPKAQGPVLMPGS